MSSYHDDVDSPGYNDTNLGVNFARETREEKEMRKIELRISHANKEIATLQADNASLLARDLEAENDSLMALARFGRWSLGFHLEGYHEKYSSYDRDAAFDLGILEEVRVEKPCSDNCQCKFYDNVFPRNCVRETPLAQLPDKPE